MQPDMADRRALLPGAAPEHHREAMRRANAVQLVGDEGAKLGHLGEHHGHDFKPIDLIVGKLARLARLHDQNAQLFADALDRDAKEAGVNFFPGFRHVAETRLGRRIAGVDRLPGARDAPDEAFAQAHPRLVDRLGLEALGGAKLKRFGVAEQIDRAHLRAHRIRDQMCDMVQPVLAAAGGRKRIAQAPQKAAAVAFAPVHHVSGQAPVLKA